MTRFHLFLLGLCLPIIGLAQGNDTLTITRYKALPAYEYTLPYMSDSVDIKGKKFDSSSLFGTVPPLDLDDHRLRSVTTSADGYYTAQKGKNTIQTLLISLLTTRYEHVTALVECPVPYRLYLEGKEIGSKNEIRPEQSIPDKYTLKLEPSAHRPLMIRYQTDDKPTNAPQIRIRLVPKLGAKTTLTLRDDTQEYMSMDFTLRGEAFTGVQMSPSGKYMVVRKRNYMDLNPSSSTLLYEGSKMRTELSGALASASWMPQSDRLWITRSTDTGRQLLSYDPATAETTIISAAIPEGDFTILPDEKTLIYVKEQEGPKTHQYVDRVMGRYDHYKNNPDRDRTFLYAYDLTTGIYRPLTFGHRSTALVSASSNGREIIISSGYDTTTSPFHTSDFMAMDLRTGKVDTLFTGNPHIGGIHHTSNPDILLITADADAFDGIGRNLPEGAVTNTYDTQLFLYNRSTKSVRALTKDFSPAIRRVLVSHKSERALFSAEDRDYVRLYQIDLRSGHITLLPNREEYVGSFSADNALLNYAYEGESSNNSDRLYIGHLGRGSEAVVNDLAAHRLHNIKLGKVADWTFTMPNGDKVPGRYYLPPDFDPNQKYPMLVYYYGGTSPSGRKFDWYYSQPMYAGQGYVMLVLNPSGTTGWGQEYSSRHVNAWGKRTADEIVAAVKGFCAEHSFVNAQKIGCFGASYGGFMTQYLQTITDIFAAAMSHAGISALSSYWGQGTWGIGYSTVASAHSYPWNNPQLYTEQSPLFRADKINTPLLLLHGTADTNVPFGESVQMYNALKILGKEVELIRVYDQDHHIVDPRKRVEWMHTTMAWFQKWLKDDPTWWDEMYPEVNL